MAFVILFALGLFAVGFSVDVLRRGKNNILSQCSEEIIDAVSHATQRFLNLGLTFLDEFLSKILVPTALSESRRHYIPETAAAIARGFREILSRFASMATGGAAIVLFLVVAVFAKLLLSLTGHGIVYAFEVTPFLRHFISNPLALAYTATSPSPTRSLTSALSPGPSLIPTFPPTTTLSPIPSPTATALSEKKIQSLWDSLIFQAPNSKLVRYARDAKGEPLDGGKNYRLHLPPDIPVKEFWSVIVDSNQTRSVLQTDQQYPSVSSQTKGLLVNPDGSVDVYFGPKAPPGKEKNWVQTIPGKEWNTNLRLYSPLGPWFDKTWWPGKIELEP
jgi:Protein of unknown function (DUF1214)